jgi:hypothetical protein
MEPFILWLAVGGLVVVAIAFLGWVGLTVLSWLDALAWQVFGGMN